MDKLTEYNSVRPYMRSGDLIEWGSASLFGGAIRLVTGKKVNHSSILLSLDKYEEFKDRRYVLEANRKVELNILSYRIREFKGTVFWSPLKPKYDHLRGQIAKWALDREGKDYDYQSLLANMFGKVSMDGKKFFCSEYYHMAMVAVGILPEGKAARPGEFEKFNIHGRIMQIVYRS